MNNSVRGLSATLNQQNDHLIVSVSGDMDDAQLILVNQNIIEKAHSSRIKGVILNFSSVKVMDAFMLSQFLTTTKTLKLFDLQVVWTGLTPGVTLSLMANNLEDDFPFHTALDLEQGIDILKKRRVL